MCHVLQCESESFVLTGKARAEGDAAKGLV